MKDRFRFRVWNNRDWDSEFGQVYYEAEKTYDYLGGKPQITASSFGELLDDDQWIVEQCAGLKDKNGKLIYEGDILFVKTLDWKKKERWNAEEVKTYWSVEYKNYWNHCGFMVFGINRRFHKPLTRTVIFNSEAEVIGNIHQNPELLKESK